MKFERWVKVIKASNEQEVLFYMQHDGDHDDSQIIRCVTRMDGYDVDTCLGGVANSKAQAAFDQIGTAYADKVVNVARLGMSDDDC